MMSVRKDRKNSVHKWQIPRCDYYVLFTEPGRDNNDGQRQGMGCGLRATHQVTYHRAAGPYTEHACQAHVGILLDRIARYRTWARRDGHDLPEPTVVELDFVADARAAAYGRKRFLRTERVVTGPITQTLIPSQLPIAPPPPRRRQADKPSGESTKRAAIQEELF